MIWVMEKEKNQTGKTLSQEYRELADKYAVAFSLKYLEGSDFYWIGNDIGGTIEICDYFVSYDTIRYSIDHDVTDEDLFSWINYGLTLGSIDQDIKIPTLDEWVHGDKGIGPIKLQEIEDAVRKVRLAEMDLRELVQSYTESNKTHFELF